MPERTDGDLKVSLMFPPFVRRDGSESRCALELHVCTVQLPVSRTDPPSVRSVAFCSESGSYVLYPPKATTYVCRQVYKMLRESGSTDSSTKFMPESRRISESFGVSGGESLYISKSTNSTSESTQLSRFGVFSWGHVVLYGAPVRYHDAQAGGVLQQRGMCYDSGQDANYAKAMFSRVPQEGEPRSRQRKRDQGLLLKHPPPVLGS